MTYYQQLKLLSHFLRIRYRGSIRRFSLKCVFNKYQLYNSHILCYDTYLCLHMGEILCHHAADHYHRSLL